MALRLAIYGLGEIGRLLGRVGLMRGHELVGAVDIDPRLIGEDVGEVIGVGRIGVRVTKVVEDGLRGADVVLHATSSFLHEVYPQLEAAIRMGKSIVSTCETLSYPFHRYPILARRLDELARARGSTVIGAGINPGFLLDALASIMAASIPIVKSIKARRSINAASRRRSFQRKMGVGMRPEDFERALRTGECTGHVGYAESVYLIAQAAGLNLSRVVEDQRPVIADEPVESLGVSVGEGMVRGVRGYGAGYVGDEEVIRVEFEALVGADDYEEIIIEGEDYSITWRSSGTPGDLGTAAVVVSVAEKIELMPYGLLTMADLIPFRIGMRWRQL